MTQAVANTKLNNIEEMLSSANKVREDATVGMDRKDAGFENVLDKTLNKIVDKFDSPKTSSDNKVSTIEEVKVLSQNEEQNIESNSWIEFKDILTEIAKEANVETSLDLTLARDINEIISQLKEAVENATESIEENVEVEAMTENLTLEELPEVDSLISEAQKEEEAPLEEDPSKQQDFVKEHFISYVDNNILQNNKEINEKEIKAQIEENLSNLEEEINISTEEVVEIVENFADEVISTKTSENNVSNDSEFVLEEELIKELKIESISAETEGFSGETLMQNQTPEEYALKAMINQEVEPFEIKVESTQNVQNSQNVQQSQAKVIDINPSRIIDQITKHLESLHSNSKVNIVLNPESLGKVNIQLLTTKDGLSAQFTVATQEARDLLMKGLDGLKEALSSQGVGVDNVSVKLAESQKTEYKQDWTEQEDSNGGNKERGQQNREEKDKGLFEKMMAQTLEDENGNV